MSTDLIASEITLPRDAVIDAAVHLIAWDRRVRDLLGFEDDFGGEGPAEVGPAEVGYQLLLASLRSAFPQMSERDLAEHPIVKSAMDRAYAGDATDATIAEIMGDFFDAVSERVASMHSHLNRMDSHLDRIEQSVGA